MPTKKYKQKLLKHQLYSVARVVACASFLILTIIGVSSLVKAMSLEAIAHENGIPATWQAASLGNPDTITIDATYWDQRQDDCNDPNRQFEWVICGYWTAGAIQGIIKDTLGADGLPVPAYTNATDAWNANRDVFTANVTGQDPVQPGDNFYRWFHETEVSKKYEAENEKLGEEMKRMYDEFQAMKEDELPAIKERKARELQDYNQKIQQFQQTAYNDLNKLNADLMGPIMQKIQTAVEAVGKEGSYSLIQPKSTDIILYFGAPVEDITNQVKAKLGVN